jgi:uncharacterized protein
MNTFTRPHLFGLLAGLLLAAGLIISASLVTSAWLRISNADVISVTGSARRNVVSDLVVWRGSFAVEEPSVLNAHKRLKGDLEKVQEFFVGRGLTNFTVSPISIEEQKSSPSSGAPQTLGYRLSQIVQFESSDISRFSQLGTETSGLVEQGVAFVSHPPEFIFTRGGEAKVEMLAEATRDARIRAEQIAKEGNRGIGRLRSAKMGVFQITAPHSTETSWEGVNDRSTAEKTITSVVSAVFVLK